MLDGDLIGMIPRLDTVDVVFVYFGAKMQKFETPVMWYVDAGRRVGRGKM